MHTHIYFCILIRRNYDIVISFSHVIPSRFVSLKKKTSLMTVSVKSCLIPSTPVTGTRKHAPTASITIE